MRPAAVAAVAVAAALSALGCAAARPAADPAAGALPELQLPRDAVPTGYRLEVTLVPERDGFAGTVEIDVAVARPLRELYLHALDLEVASAEVRVAGQVIPARLAQLTPEGLARLTPARTLPAGRATLRLAFSGRWDGQVVGLYRVSRRGAAYAYTQLESVAARRAFPCFDEPSFKAPFEIAILVRPGDVAVSNGPALAAEPRGDLVRVRFARTPPLPTYLVFLGAGPFDVVEPGPIPPNEVRDRPLPLRGLAPRGDGPALRTILDLHAELLPILERWFGIPFPYEKLDVLSAPESPVSMENAGAITYSDALALFAEGRSPEALRTVLASTVAHEVAHQWFGDLVTPAWWDDVWLKESFATWLEERALRTWRPALGTEAERVRDAARRMRADGLASARVVRLPLLRIAEVDAQYSGASYGKGAAVLEAFARFLGEDRFQAALRAFLREHAHGNATAEDFFAALSAAGGRDLAGPLRSFLDRPGVPTVRIRTVCDAAGARLELAQQRWIPLGSRAAPGPPWGLPLCVRLGAGAREEQACVLLEGASGTLPLPGCPDWLAPSAGGSGYHLWSVEAGDGGRLPGAAAGHLSPAERSAELHALLAAARAGAVPLGGAMDGALRLAASDSDDAVARAALEFVAAALQAALPGDRAAVAARVAAALRPRLAALGWEPGPSEAAPRRRLRAELADFLALVVQEPATAREAAARGRAFAAPAAGEGFDAGAVEADLSGTALAAALREGDEPFLRGVVARLRAAADPELRQRVTGALGRVVAPEAARAALALAAERDLPAMDRLALLEQLEQQPETTEDAWATLRESFDDLAASLPAWWVGGLPLAAAGSCEARRAAELRAFFEPRLSRVPAMRRPLADAAERVEVCAAFRSAQGPGLAAWAAGR